jgi:polysaccharide export outer membrane protein
MNLPRTLLPAVLVAVALVGGLPAARAEDPPVPPPAAPSPEGAGAAPSAAAAPARGERTDWRTGDELDVKVLSRADLSCTVRVLADGTVDVPFAGRFKIAERTTEQLRAEVETAFGKHERQPQVAVTVASLAPDEFYVLGDVGKAGVYTVPRTKRVSFLQALGMAGGFAPEADFTRVQVIPASGAAPRTVDASPARMAALATVWIGNGDTIVVPSVGRIYMMGQLNRTGGFAPPAGERMTLSRAIALGGGFTRLADSKSVTVSWRDAQGAMQSQRYNVNAILAGVAEDVAVYPGNLIFVPERLL